MESIVVGVDVSKDKLDVCNGGKRVERYSNEDKGISRFVCSLRSIKASLVVFEATGGYEYQLAEALYQAKICYCVVNPARIRNFARSLGRTAKTDQIDARVIWHYGELMKPEPTVIVSKAEKELNLLAIRRTQLIQTLTAEKNRRREYLPAKVKESLARSIKTLQAEIKELDKAIDAAVASDQKISAKVALIQTITGVGRVTAFSLLSSVPELGIISKKKVAALVGVAPFNRDSGLYKGKMTTSGGRASARTALYMAALVAARYNPTYKAFYQSLLARGKAKKVALVAVMRKLLIAINSMIKHDKPWNQQLYKK